MLRSLVLKLSLLCVAFACLTSVAPAQPANDQASLSDQDLHKIFTGIDPDAKITKEADGSTTYHYSVKRDYGTRMKIVANVFDGKVMLSAMVCEPFAPTTSLGEINKNLSQQTDLQPLVMAAYQLDDGRVVFVGHMVIDRSLSLNDFVKQWNYFHQTARNIHVG